MNLQLTITLGVVFFSSCYLLSRAWGAWKGTGRGCGGCGSAKPNSQNSLEKQLISLGTGRLAGGDKNGLANN